MFIFLFFISMGSFCTVAMELPEDDSKKEVPKTTETNRNSFAKLSMPVKNALNAFLPGVKIIFPGGECLKMESQSFLELSDHMKTMKDYRDDNQKATECDLSQSPITLETFQIISSIVTHLPGNYSINTQNRMTLIQDKIKKHVEPLSIEQLESCSLRPTI